MNVPMPTRVARLPVDKHGYPVPWFVAWIDGVPDFRVIRIDGLRKAIEEERCWICGKARNRRSLSAFVIGPMCSVNRVSPEPPSHPDCATYSAKVCPFLTKPVMRRRESRIPADAVAPAGHMIRRNPGVALVWFTRRWRIEDVGHGVLWRVGEPERVEWYAQGRAATRAEVEESIRTGLPILRQMALEDGPAAVRQLEEMKRTADQYLPEVAA